MARVSFAGGGDGRPRKSRGRWRGADESFGGRQGSVLFWGIPGGPVVRGDRWERIESTGYEASKSPRSDVVGKPSLRSGAAGEKCVTGKGGSGALEDSCEARWMDGPQQRRGQTGQKWYYDNAQGKLQPGTATQSGQCTLIVCAPVVASQQGSNRAKPLRVAS